jgi:hypothetical protein
MSVPTSEGMNVLRPCTGAMAGVLDALLKTVYKTTLGQLIGIEGVTAWKMPSHMFTMGITSDRVQKAIEYADSDDAASLDSLRVILGLPVASDQV